VRARGLMNNFILRTEKRLITFHIFQSIISTKNTNKCKKLIFDFIKENSITPETSDPFLTNKASHAREIINKRKEIPKTFN